MGFYRRQVSIVALCAVMAGCSTPVKVRSLKVSGDEAAISGFLIPARETFEEESGGVGLDLYRSRLGAELPALVRGEVDAVVSVHPLEELIRAAAAEQVTIDPSLLRTVDVGSNDTIVLLNRQNSIKKISRSQLKGIFTGTITNWKQLHGENRPVVVVWNGSPAAERELMLNDILGSDALTPKLVTVYSYDEVRKRIEELPGAIGIVPSVFSSATVKVPAAPRVSSSVIVVTRGEPSRQVGRLTDILKDMAILQ